MWSVTHPDYHNQFSKDMSAIASTFCASRFEFEDAEWIIRIWKDLNARAGHRWHIIVPTHEPIQDDDSKIFIENFNFELSNRIIDYYRIPARHLPVLVFDNYLDEERQPYLTIPKDSRESRDFCFRIADLIHQKFGDQSNVHPRRRYQIIEEVVGRIRAEKTFGKLLRFAPPGIGAALGFFGGAA